eukprot:TRINITY_DN2496_c0_g1_i10.p1 TRINITY_DN2496_c0_g1~~TRINITY_DN2496_c0_g1_i10.p1  ORF type:complete len:184 (-),score=42.73 TRINITY_DN2496_c0_g1_i10:4-555(-)
MIRRPPRSTQGVSSAASDVYKRQTQSTWEKKPDEVQAIIPPFKMDESSIKRSARNASHKSSQISKQERSVVPSINIPKKGKIGKDSERSGEEASYGAPTIKLLNPELYEKSLKRTTDLKHTAFDSVKQIQEILSYIEPRGQRVQRRREEIEAELKRREEENIIKSRTTKATQYHHSHLSLIHI